MSHTLIYHFRVSVVLQTVRIPGFMVLQEALVHIEYMKIPCDTL